MPKLAAPKPGVAPRMFAGSGHRPDNAFVKDTPTYRKIHGSGAVLGPANVSGRAKRTRV